MLALLWTTTAALVVSQVPAANDPKLLDYYARQVKFLQETPAYAVEVRLDWKTEGQGEGEGTSGTNLYKFQYQKPGTFRIEVRPGRKEGEPDAPSGPSLIVASDGKTVTTFHPGKSLYMQVPLVDLKDALANNPIVSMSLDGSLLDTLLRDDLVEIVRDHANGGKHEGTETVDGRALDRFTLRWGADDEILWFGPPDEPLPRRLVRTVAVPVPDKPPLKLVTTATLDWNTKPGEFPEGTFTIDLPEKARKVEDVYTALVQGDTVELLGKPAPELNLQRLGGGPAVTLAAHKGKEIVVLDFWASWCVPCVELLPTVAKLAEAYRAKGVVVYSVNVGEELGQIEPFVKGRKYTMDVLLDPEGKAIEAYGVTSIPALVVIGKDGTVQAVHNGGTAAELEKTLSRELDTLLSGKPLEPKTDGP
jgi:thiol-disulfide isomerase/thioredoxin